jgi:hypothetical protein
MSRRPDALARAFEARMKIQPTKTNAEPTKLPDIGVAKHFTDPMKNHPCLN